MSIDLNQLRSAQMLQILNTAVRTRRAELTDYLWRRCGGLVLSGPFKGMRLLEETSWGDGDLAAKILGCYEQELWPHVEGATRGPYRRVVNVGCAEGYYAVGLALALKEARVHALDRSARSQKICRQAAALNGVGERVVVGGDCTPAILAALLSTSEPQLLVMDCEGAERVLLDPALVPGLIATDFIVECHDFASAGVTAALRERLAASHRLQDVLEGTRDPNQYAVLRPLGSLDRWMIICENRPCTMNWLIGRSLAAA
jgi:predicted O-methyltransferase YrrM